MRKIFRYWRNKGVDVTAELYHGKTPGNYLRTDPSSACSLPLGGTTSPLKNGLRYPLRLQRADEAPSM